MSEWKEYRLDDFAKVIMGLSPSGDTYNEEQKGVPLLNGPTEFGDTHPNCTIYTTDSKRICKTKDLIFCVRGSTTGRMNWADKPYSLGRGVCSITGKDDLTTKFLKHLLTVNLEGLLQITSGGTFPNLKKEDINGFTFRAPIAYRKIAKILSNYDDLIENNLKRIKLLEESARLTYEEWFLRFRIDGKKLEIDPESGLPFGWESKLMKDFGEVVTGKTPSTNNESYYGGDIPFVKTPSMHGNTYTLETADYLTSLGANSQQNKFLSKNSLMVSCIGTAGVCSLVASNCQTNQQINSIKFYKDEYIFYIYGFAGHLTNVLDAIGSNGATMTNVNKTKFENIKVPMPSVDLLERFHNTFNPNFESILNIMKQNQLLKEARDILLPRLMTGMIDTDDMDIAV